MLGSTRNQIRSFFRAPEYNDRLPWRIFWVGLAVRVLYMTLAHTYRIRPGEDHFQFGWEAGRIARALVTGHGYADLFANAAFPHTGPTAWLPPLYPLLLAAIFKVCGVYSPLSAWVLLSFNSVCSAATALAVWEIAARCVNRRVALWSAWLWALYPAAMQYAVRWPWEMSLTTALFSFALVVSLRMAASSQLSVLSCQKEQRQLRTENGELTSLWLLFGLLWGLIALSNSTLLVFLPVHGVWTLWGTWKRRHSVLGAVLAALVFVACVAPWTLRNYVAFHAFIPMRSNFGAELYMGNGPGSNGLLMEYDHPFQSPEQLRLYAAMGEVRYVAMRGAAAKVSIAADPAHFVADTLRRIDFFWVSVPHPDPWYMEAVRTVDFAFTSFAGLLGLGLALRNRVPAAGLFAWAFVLLPVPYYMVTVHARFRHPLEPLICIFSVYLFQSATRGRAKA